jgi:hypothetical protein
VCSFSRVEVVLVLAKGTRPQKRARVLIFKGGGVGKKQPPTKHQEKREKVIKDDKQNLDKTITDKCELTSISSFRSLIKLDDLREVSLKLVINSH